MFEISRFELRRRARGTVYLSIALIAYSALIVGIFPSIEDAGVDFEAYVESLPPEISRAFVGEASSFTTIEGFLGTELYQFVLLILLGMYFAYLAGSSLASEVEDGSIDLLLVHPISRTRVLVGKSLAILLSIAAVNLVLLVGVYLGVGFIGEEIDVVDLVLLHVLAVPYLAACASFGMLSSVLFDTSRRAQTTGAGGVFSMFLLDVVTLDSDLEWLGALSFSRYFAPNEILSASEVDWGGAAILIAASLLLVVVSAEYFERADVS